VELISCFFLLLILGLLFGLFYTFSKYNQLNRLRQEILEASSNIQVIMQKRLDLVQQLIAVADRYAQIEAPVFMSLGRMTADINSMNSAAAQIASAMNRVVLLSQRYPELKSSEQFQKLMAEQTQVEQDLQHKREEYNAKVKEYNVIRSTFPVSLVANMLNFPEFPYWQSEVPSQEMQVARYQAPGMPGGVPGGAAHPLAGFFSSPASSPPATAATLPPTGASHALPGSVHAWLEVVRGATGSPIVSVFDGLVLGRGSAADVQLTDTTVSRRHAIIRVSQGRCFLQDQNSSNGTYVNGQRITAKALEDGDRIVIGDAELIFHTK